MEADLISVNIVAYNAGATLGLAIESALAQVDVQLELVIVDDASVDSTAAVAESYRGRADRVSVIVLSNSENLGIAKSRNRALNASTGSYIAVLDSDDFWTGCTKLRDQLRFLKDHPHHVAVGTQMRIVGRDVGQGRVTSYPLDDDVIRRSILLANRFCHSSILMRNIGQQYDESLYIWEDYDLFLRLGLQGRFANLPQCLVEYLYVPRKYTFRKKVKLVHTEMTIVGRYRELYPNATMAYFVRLIKLLLVIVRYR